MTWGDVVGTPLHLKDEDDEEEEDSDSEDEKREKKRKVEKSRGEFRVPATPQRDELAWQLDAAAKDKNKALKSTQRRRSGSVRNTPRTPTLSPAAQALLKRTGVMLLLHCCYTVVTLLLHCRYTVFS
jgi:hypothetical protein